MTLFDMFNKAAGLTEDAKKYNTGDISEKTGLQKQPDGSWKPPKAKGSQPKGTEKKAEATNGSAKPLTRTEATERVFQNHIKEFKDIKKQYSKLPRKELERVYSQKVSRTNSVETLPKGEIAEALTQHEMLNKYSGEIRELLKKPENTSSSSDDIAINPHEEVKEHLNASKYYKQKAKGFTKTDPSYKKYLAKAEEYENKAKAAADDYGLDFSEFIDDSAPLTADTKIKLSQIKTTDDAGFEEGHVSHRKNGDFVKQGGKWVPAKKNGQGNKKQAETQSSTTGIPSPELVKKRLERAEKRKAEINATRTNETESSKTTAKSKTDEPLKWEKMKDDSELAKQNGNSLVITKHYDGSYSWRVGTHPAYPSERGYAKTREEAVKKTTEASRKHPGEIQMQGLTWKRSPKSSTNSDRWTAADNGNIMTIQYNYFDNTYDYTVYEEGRAQQATFKKGKAKTRDEAMKEAFKASDEHEHSGIRPIRIPAAQAMGLSYASWNNEDMYASKPRKVAKKK